LILLKSSCEGEFLKVPDRCTLAVLRHDPVRREEEDIMSERDYLAKEEALRRLSEPAGDHELHAALERMRVDHPHLWEVLHRLHLAHDADPSKLEEWRRAPEGSQEQIWAAHYDQAMGVLAMSFE
jgi:hypothetical protein